MVKICQNCQNSLWWSLKHKLSNSQLISYICKAELYLMIHYLSGFLIHLLVNGDFQLTVTQNSTHFVNILLTSHIHNLRIEHATWFILVPKCSLFYLQWDKNNISNLTFPSKCLIYSRWVWLTLTMRPFVLPCQMANECSYFPEILHI